MIEKTPQDFRKGFRNYIDIFVSSLNFAVIFISLIFFRKNILISVLGILISGIFIVLTIYTFINNNPLYIYYCYGLLICSLLYVIPSIMIFSWIGILLLPDIFYFYEIYRSRGQSSAVSMVAKTKFMQKAGNMGLIDRNLTQTWDNINPQLELKRQQQREELERQYSGKKILRNSLILSLSLIVIFIPFAITFFA
ncbi:MAG: hypothetical protein ACXAAI_05065 [Promethearchaeota archaeon]|jgi:hypothetical protein